ncbi:MAG: Flp family type IVb pilin [Phycisphaerae bacterium]|nr:Flp family type IVb pilin [Phycisphaerae bacterium]
MDLLRRGLERAREFLVSEEGPSATEYAILLALIVLGSMATIQQIGESMQAIYEEIETAIPTV